MPRETRRWHTRTTAGAGGCEIRLDGAEYRADRPQFVGGPEAKAAARQAFGWAAYQPARKQS